MWHRKSGSERRERAVLLENLVLRHVRNDGGKLAYEIELKTRNTKHDGKY
jgi:hypothetical protein